MTTHKKKDRLVVKLEQRKWKKTENEEKTKQSHECKLKKKRKFRQKEVFPNCFLFLRGGSKDNFFWSWSSCRDNPIKILKNG